MIYFYRGYHFKVHDMDNENVRPLKPFRWAVLPIKEVTLMNMALEK